MKIEILTKIKCWNIDGDYEECETMIVKFKSLLDEVRDLFSTG
jgi:hypothetical protein